MPRWGYALLVVAVFVAAGCGARSNSAGRAGSEPDLWQSLRPGWSSLAPPPFARVDAVSVWTGRELFYWGGFTNYSGTQHADGAVYEAAGRAWKRLPASPLGARSSAVAVWTGREVLVWGGWAGGEGEWSDGAAFEPATGKWRMLPTAPLSPRQPVAAVWTGSEMIVWGDRSRSRSAKQREGAAYDPASNEWRTLAPAPQPLNEANAVWTGKEMIVFGAHLDGNNWSDTDHAQGIAYDPDTNAWRVISAYPLSPQASSVAWTGKEVVAWDYLLNAGAYDPSRDTWRKLPAVPLRPSECYPTSVRVGAVIVAWYCGDGAVFDISKSVWHRMPAVRGENFGRPVAAGSVVLFPGQDYEGAADALSAFKP